MLKVASNLICLVVFDGRNLLKKSQESLTKDQCVSMFIIGLKSAYYGNVSAMGALSGFGWNEETQTVAAAKEVWTEYLALTLELHIITCFVVYLKECIRIKL